MHSLRKRSQNRVLTLKQLNTKGLRLIHSLDRCTDPEKKQKILQKLTSIQTKIFQKENNL